MGRRKAGDETNEQAGGAAPEDAGTGGVNEEEQGADPGVSGGDSDVPSSEEIAERQALLGRMSPLERAMHAFGLEQRHILNSKLYTMEDGSVEVAILTQGGQRLRWPKDEGRVLSAMEKGDAVPQAPAGGIFKS